MNEAMCSTCGAPLYSVTGPDGTERVCTEGHRFETSKSNAPKELLEIADDMKRTRERELVGEMAGSGDGNIGLLSGEMMTTEEAVNSVPLGEGVNLEELLDGDEELPRQVVVEVAAGGSKRGWIYKREALAKIAGEVMNGGLPGYKGHPKPEELSHKFIDPVTHWVGAKEVRPGVFRFRGVVDKAAGELKRWLRTKRVTQVSIFGEPIRKGNVVYDYVPISIDWTPLKRAGMPTSVVALGEMDYITEPGKEATEKDRQKGDKMDLAEIVGELRKEGVKPETLIGEMNWRAEDVVKATGLKLEQVGPALASEEWDALQATHKTFGEIAETLGEKDPEKIKKAIDDGKEALSKQRTAERDKVVGEVLEDKVAGETAQAVVKDSLGGMLEDDASKEDIEKAVGEILERPHIKTFLKDKKRASASPAGTRSGTKDKPTGEQNAGTGEDRKPDGVRRKTVHI